MDGISYYKLVDDKRKAYLEALRIVAKEIQRSRRLNDREIIFLEEIEFF